MHGDELAETAADPALATGSRPLGPGDSIGRYRVQRVLGQGGMGVVYAAHDPDLDRAVALKVLRGAAGDEARTRLLREARAMAKLSHPNVITVYEVGSAGPIDFVAMELIDGKSLADWLAGGRRPAAEVLRIFRAAARGLQAAHVAGLVHRDFKPANVLLGRHDRVVVTDFGLARAFDDLVAPDAATLAAATTQPIATAASSRPDAASLSSTLTRTGAMLGTPAYMAPEQFAGLTAGPRSDQYAFCVALWEALTGARPFQGATLDDLRRAAQAGDVRGADAVPRGLRPVLLRGMARDAADRFPDLGALIAAIDRAERRPRFLAVALTAGLAALLALAAVALWPRGEAGRERATAPPCRSADDELAAAWSPARSRALEARLGSLAGTWRELSEGLDRRAVAWRAEHATTCALADGPARDGELACLALVRDQLAAVTVVAEGTPPDQVRPAALLDEVDDPARCRHPAARTRPPLPADPAARTALSAIRVDLTRALLDADDAAARALADGAVTRARELGDPAALAEALIVAGVVARRADDPVRAEALFDEAAVAAETIAADGLRATAIVAATRSLGERSSDAARVRAGLTRARAAVTRAGDPPELLAHLDASAAILEASEGNLDAAIGSAERARLGFDEVDAARLAIAALRFEANARAVRDRDDDVARATELLSDAIARSVRVHGDDGRVTHDLRERLAWLLADHDPSRAAEVFARLPRVDEPPPKATVRRGRVVGPDGRPRAGAIVHVGERLVALADGTIVTAATEEDRGPRRAATDLDGRFTIAALPDEVAIVVAGDLRSRPVRVSALPSTLVVRPTHRARLRSPLGDAGAGSLTVVFTVADGDLELDYQAITHRLAPDVWEASGLPDAATLQVLVVRIDRATTDYLTRRFTPRAGQPAVLAIEPPPPGASLEVVVRGDRLVDIPGANVFVLPGRALAGRTLRLADFGGRAFRSERLFSGYARPADPSVVAGAADSHGGDLRLVVPNVPAGPITLCVLPLALDVRDPRLFKSVVADTDDLELHCRGAEVPAGAASHRVVVETPAMQRPR